MSRIWFAIAAITVLILAKAIIWFGFLPEPSPNGVFGTSPEQSITHNDLTGVPNHGRIVGLNQDGDNWLALRSEPSANSGYRIKKMLPDTRFTVSRQQGGWYQISLSTGEVGWAAAKYISCCSGEDGAAISKSIQQPLPDVTASVVGREAAMGNHPLTAEEFEDMGHQVQRNFDTQVCGGPCFEPARPKPVIVIVPR